MKKTCIILLTIILCSGIVMAADSETKISLSMGTYTGAMGFVLEHASGLPAVYTGLGITPRTFRIVAGGRIYMPDMESKLQGVTKRSNVFIGPVAGIIWEHVNQWDPEKLVYVTQGPIASYWGGLTGGYDFNWGQYDEYHLTVEGGMGFNITNTTDDPNPYMPIFNLSLGYSF